MMDDNRFNILDFGEPEKENSIIKVIGVGGGGGNAVNHMYREGIHDVTFVLCNTDNQALNDSPVPVHLQLGKEGLGAGNKPEKARKAAEESIDDVRNMLSDGTKMAFITAGMGGGTGTGAAPVIARISKELGILTVGIVTIPFRFEGPKKIDQALEKLEKALMLGYRNFKHLEYDHDMDPIRDLPRYKALVEKYKAIFARELEEENLPAKTPGTDVSEVAFSRHAGGTFEVPCQINGLPLKMIFDTGASDVSISSVEANFMLKNDYLSENDIKGKRYYQTASGQISPGAVITLREVRLGDAVLKNVEASVVNSQNAPLLFGQSAMERFGTITIDNENNKLIIKH